MLNNIVTFWRPDENNIELDALFTAEEFEFSKYTEVCNKWYSWHFIGHKDLPTATRVNLKTGCRDRHMLSEKLTI